MKKWFVRILLVAVILVMIFSPYLLIVDFRRYSPVVLMIWILSIAYYLLLKRRVDQRLEEDREMEEEDDVSRET